MKLNETQIGLLIDGLRASVVEVVFTKKNGDKRVMKCTLMDSHIPNESMPKSLVVEDEEMPELVRVFDIERQGWRSIIFDTIVDFKPAQ